MSGPQSVPRVDPEALLAAAEAAREQAYVPYSRFRVGAAVLADSGAVYRGCNVENVSYPLCTCAERVAVTAAVAAGERRLLAVAVVAGDATDGPPAGPCGSCRQVLYEFGPDMDVILPGPPLTGALVQPLRDLLPHAFGPEDLERGRERGRARGGGGA